MHSGKERALVVLALLPSRWTPGEAGPCPLPWQRLPQPRQQKCCCAQRESRAAEIAFTEETSENKKLPPKPNCSFSEGRMDNNWILLFQSFETCCLYIEDETSTKYVLKWKKMRIWRLETKYLSWNRQNTDKRTPSLFLCLQITLLLSAVSFPKIVKDRVEYVLC